MPRFPTVPRTFAGFQSEPATERVIAFGRLALSIGGLFAIYADPAQRPGATLEFVILGAYVAFALACLVIFRRPVSAHWTFLSHAPEIGLVCLIIGYTEAPTSP